MKIPSRNLPAFVREVVDMCTVSQRDRIQRGLTYKNFALYGAEQPQAAATFNKSWTYLGDLRSLMYSPVSLRFNISDNSPHSRFGFFPGSSVSQRSRDSFRLSYPTPVLFTIQRYLNVSHARADFLARRRTEDDTR